MEMFQGNGENGWEQSCITLQLSRPASFGCCYSVGHAKAQAHEGSQGKTVRGGWNVAIFHRERRMHGRAGQNPLHGVQGDRRRWRLMLVLCWN
jgi:hypothetical protein